MTAATRTTTTLTTRDGPGWKQPYLELCFFFHSQSDGEQSHKRICAFYAAREQEDKKRKANRLLCQNL